MQSADRVVLGGLVEGVWPPDPRPDPWLSRPMRNALGLDLPEELDASELLGRAIEAGVTFVPGADFGGPPNSMRLAFSFVSPAEIDEGVSRLARLVASAPAPA